MSSMRISNLTKEKLKEMLEKEKRFDGRDLLEFRDFEITYEVSKKAEGSARVKLGKTEVVVGVKLSVEEPYPDSKDKGNLMVSGDLLPLASPRFESGPPGFEGIELPRLVDRAIRESGMIELKKLVIKEREKVWGVTIDIYPINDDGNLIDASCLGAVAALKSAVFPEYDENEGINYEKKTSKKIPLSKETAPITFSFFKLSNSIILDPTREEEEACDSRITFSISRWNDQYVVNSCQKKGEDTFSLEEITEMMKILPKKFDEIDKKLKKFL